MTVSVLFIFRLTDWQCPLASLSDSIGFNLTKIVKLCAKLSTARGPCLCNILWIQTNCVVQAVSCTRNTKKTHVTLAFRRRIMSRGILSVFHLFKGFNWNAKCIYVICSYIVLNVNFALSDNGKDSFNSVLDPDTDPEHHHNLINSNVGQV